MTSQPASRLRALSPSLFFAALIGLAGCATQAPGPVAPISTGGPRVDPVPGEATEDSEFMHGDSNQSEANVFGIVDSDGAYVPPHMQGRPIVRAGVMLPFSDRRASVREEAEGMLAAIELALFDIAGENIVLLPKDTRGSQTTTKDMAEELVGQGADLVLGPLFAGNVTATREIFTEEGAPIVSFSNDSSIAGGGNWLASIAPEAEVAEIIRYASLRGYDQFAYFGPQSGLGMRVERAMQLEAFNNGGRMIGSGFYPSGEANPNVEAEALALTIANAAALGGRVAVLVPERGNRLRRIAPLLAYYGVDTREVKMLGLGGWNDPAIWREPSLNGAWFPSPPAADIADFQTRYQRQYGRLPSSLAALAYDAAALAVTLAEDGTMSAEELTNQDGFAGINGLFRFRADGTMQRSLSIMEIDPQSETGVKQIQSVASSFDPSAS